jgi:phosphoglycerate-specific signal transduction histidine kinase
MVDERLGTICADERKVKQVLLNLLSNALKFTPEGGRIDVAATVTDDAIEISVSDTGVGIAAEDQAAVFEEFRQVGAASKKSKALGSGSPSHASSSSCTAARSGSRVKSALARPSRLRCRCNDFSPAGIVAPRMG